MQRRTSSARSRGWRARFGVPIWLILAFWVAFGFVVGNQILMSMPDHGHSPAKMIGWQMGAALGWAALTPLVLWLGRRFPLEPRFVPAAAHLALSFVVAAVQVLPTTLLAIPIDPYTPIAEAKPLWGEYRFQLDNWLLLNVLLYFGIVALGTGIETKRRQLREERLRAELARAELRALRLELQPHFLFNSLNAVAGLLRRGAADEAERMLIQLSELLRRTLDAAEQPLVTVSEELRFTELYLEIQRLRLGERLAVRIDADPEAAAVPVPNLVLQPIVENAIQHGIGRQAAGGTVTVSARRRGERLTLRVENDGPGLDQEDARAGGTDSPGGYGLENVSSRLEAVYGQDWELDLFDSPAGGVVAEISIPTSPGLAGDPAPQAEEDRTRSRQPAPAGSPWVSGGLTEPP